MKRRTNMTTNSILSDVILNYLNKKEDNTQSSESLKHSKSYSLLLETYVKTTKTSIRIKNFLKCFFFLITMGSMITIVALFFYTITYAFNYFISPKNINNISMETIFSMITIILPSISSLIVAFIKIPEIIAKYLFNIQEDDNMNKIIKNIQDYDIDMFAKEHRVEEILMKNKRVDKELKDENMIDSPKEQSK